MILLEHVEKLQPVEAAALQPDVEKHEVGPARDDRCERLVAVGSRARAVPLVLQNAGDQFADIRLIIHDQDIGCHDQTVTLCVCTGAAGASTGSTAKRKLHPCPARARNLLRGVAQFDAPAMLLKDAADDGKAQSGTLLARRHIGLEQPRAVLLRQSDAVVDHVDDDVLAFALRAHRDTPAVRRRR